MRWVGMLCLLAALATPATAGELLLANGSRLDADLTSDVLLVSTGTDLIEVAPETVGLLTAGEVQLKDGRVLRGTLVGGRLKTRTTLGELAITVDELRQFRADGFAAMPAAVAAPAPPPATPAAPARPEPAPVTPTAPGAAAPSPVTPAPAPEATGSRATAALTPTVAPTPTPGPTVASVTEPGARPPVVAGSRLEVVIDQSALLRDAVTAAPPVGRVARGERVMYLDSIDRRLRFFNAVLFDGGFWIKVRAADGTEGWLPASTLREAR
ncbi:MAG TPA: SH3 domain-containing protein [Methylomirabilota bacterium]|nr:SH3 domain-containing protein [Methylomirabilota bacterium]